MIGSRQLKSRALSRAELEARLADHEAALLSEDPQRIEAAQLACSVALERHLDANADLVRLVLAELS